MANILTDPPFAADPPIKLNIPAKTVGLVAAILGIIGLVVLRPLRAERRVRTHHALRRVLTALAGCNAGGIFFLALIGVHRDRGRRSCSTSSADSRCTGSTASGKALVIYGLAVGLIGGIFETIGVSALASLIFDILWFVVGWYIVVISRWPGDAPLVASTPGGYGNPPGGYGSPPPPPPPSV